MGVAFVRVKIAVVFDRMFVVDIQLAVKIKVGRVIVCLVIKLMLPAYLEHHQGRHALSYERRYNTVIVHDGFSVPIDNHGNREDEQQDQYEKASGRTFSFHLFHLSKIISSTTFPE